MLRLVRVQQQVRRRGYIGWDTVFYQCLMDGKREMGREEIPFDVIVDMRCFGSTEWRSKWAKSHPELFVRKANVQTSHHSFCMSYWLRLRLWCTKGRH